MLPGSQSICSTAVLATSLTSPLATFPKLASGARNSIRTSMYWEHLSAGVPSLPQHSFNMAKKPSSLFGLESSSISHCLCLLSADKTSQGEGALFTAATLELRATPAPNRHLVGGCQITRSHRGVARNCSVTVCISLHLPEI